MTLHCDVWSRNVSGSGQSYPGAQSRRRLASAGSSVRISHGWYVSLPAVIHEHIRNQRKMAPLSQR